MSLTSLVIDKTKTDTKGTTTTGTGTTNHGHGHEQYGQRVKPNPKLLANRLAGGQPTPGSLEHHQQLLKFGDVFYDPTKVITDFFRYQVERERERVGTTARTTARATARATGDLLVKPEYQADTALVYQQVDSSIYGHLEPNLALQTDILSAYRSNLLNMERWLVEAYLLDGQTFKQIGKRFRLSAQTVSKRYHTAIRKLVERVFCDADADADTAELGWLDSNRHRQLSYPSNDHDDLPTGKVKGKDKGQLKLVHRNTAHVPLSQLA